MQEMIKGRHHIVAVILTIRRFS